MKYRVELLSTKDSNSGVKAGDKGDLVNIRFNKKEKIRILDVEWDSGSSFSLTEGQDKWKVFEEDE
jgi:hypothetical protein